MNALRLLWSFYGRIGRAAYAGGLLLNLTLLFTAAAIIMILNEQPVGELPNPTSDFTLLLPTLVVVMLSTLGALALTAKRFHDLGVTGWLCLLLLVPGAGLIVAIVLLIARGNENDNRYGPGAASIGPLEPAHRG